MKALNLICVLLYLALILWTLAKVLREPTPETALARGWDRPLSRRGAVLLWILVLCGCLLRLWRFGSVPAGVNQDEAMAAVDALALAHYGTDRLGMRLPAHFTAWAFGQMSVLLSYCMVPFFRLFGMDPVTVRLPSLLWSLGGMAALYFFLRCLISPRAALIGLLAAALCPWHFMQSRWSLDCNLFPHVFLIGFALLWRGLKKPWALFVSMVFFSLCMYSYGLAFLSVPLFLLLACILLLASRRVRPGQVLLCALIYLGLSFPIIGTMLINAMGWKTVELPFVTMAYFPESIRANDLVFFSDAPLQQLRLNFRELLNAGFSLGPDLTWNAIDGFGTLYLCSWPLLLLGLALSLRRAFRSPGPRRRLGYRLLLLYWLCALVTGLCVNGVNVNRINILFYVNLLFVVLGIHALTALRPVSARPLLASFLLLSSLFFFQYFGPWAQRISVSFYADFLSAVDDAGSRDFDVLYITPDVQFTGSRQTSEILTVYQLQLDAAYTQGKTNDPAPYRERFVYRNLTEEDLNAPREGVCWVLKSSQLPESLPPGWSLRSFGSYAELYYLGG